MQSYSALRDTTNPYLKQLHAGLSEHVDVRVFSWRDALLGRFDVLHVHWPELLLRSPSATRRALRRIAVLALLLRIRVGRRALVRTVHNPEPHETGSAVERALLTVVDRWTTLFVLLVPTTPLPVADRPFEVIPHGDYRQWFEHLAVPPSEAGRMAYVGLVRPYKGVEELVAVFGGTAAEHPTWTLRIVGKAQSDRLAAAITAATRDDPRISARLDYVSDAELADEVGRAQLVVLPYREMHNSGTALLALSLGRPILVPRNPVTSALAEETGSAWVRTYAAPLTAADLADALATVPDGAGPDLSGREWAGIAARHAAAYRRAAQLRRSR
ncbi:glycosyltransferase [Nakamurella endophytica]|uniref:GDP-mannose:glycolipid 4-beta-D-mannosyltransferase n=1 Tax=Nakamurella endophytica TaxID=1748367 RepID=A0A917SLZ1_9ACTN|nr:glycosyltransferase [Nakamurella endophytica]GGL87396.1 GDP-mannose:glycolipid 4-beta-D-mannosyltransferase [Nakamurella endophytica]